MMKRTINYRLLSFLLVVGILGIGAAFLIHAGQMRRHAHTLMSRARQAETEGRLDEAMRSLQRYLVFAPEDNAARARCGEMMEELAASNHERWRAVEVYQQVLYREPSRRDIRRRLARLALRLGWTLEARAHLEMLLNEQPGQGDLEYWLGQCQEEAREYSQAAASYQSAIHDDPGQVEAYIRLALLYQDRLDQPENAEHVFDELVRNNGKSAEAYLARAIQRMDRGALTEAARDMDRARDLAPDDARVLLTASELERRRGRWDEARRCLERGRRQQPSRLAPHLALAALELQRNRPREAIACLRQGLQALPDQPDLLLLLGETLLDLGDEPGAAQVMERLRHPGSPPGLAHYFDGRRHMHRAEWIEAIRILEEVTQSPDSPASLASRASLALARCYAQRGDNERQLAALRRAVALGESSAPGRLALAAALQSMGRVDDALEQYREIVQLPQAPAESWVLLGRLLVQRNRSLPPRKRRWQEVEKVLDRAERLPALEVPLAVLRAEVLLEQGRADTSRTLLEKTAADHPDALELWTALADLAYRQGEAARSLQVLEEARQRLSNRRELYESEIALALTLPSRQSLRTLRTLEKERERLPAEDRLRVLGQLAAAYFRLAEPEEGRRLSRLLAEQAPQELTWRLPLLDLALQGGEEALLADLTADVRRLEGEEGTWWRYGEAAQRLLKAQRGETREREAARALVADLVRRRPDWSRGALLQAYLHEQDGAFAEAASAYLRAFRGGERQPGLVERLVGLLVEQGRLDEADEVIHQYQQQALPSPELARLGVEIALRQRGNERALELARLAVPGETSDYQQLIWLGQVLTQAGRPAEGEEMLRQAVRQRGDLAETWLALIAQLAKIEQNREAEETREDMRRSLPPEQLPLALAVAAEILAQWDHAEGYYRQALARTPDDALVLQRAARFYVRLNRGEQAEPLLRRLLAGEANALAVNQAWARRQLALLLAFAGDDAKYRQALALLPENSRQREDSILRRRARLLVRGTRPEERGAALRRLEESAKVQPFTPEELFCLVRLYEAEKNDEAARERMLDLLTLERNNPEYLAHHIERLLQRGRKDEARPWIAHLRKLEPGSSRVQSFTAGVRKP